MEVTKHQPGMFCWANCPTLELDKAQDFYASLLKLDATRNEIAGTTYVVLNRAGKYCCALYTMDEASMQERGGPWWVSYFTVDDADAAAERVKGLGGLVWVEPFDVFEEGRMAVVADSTGAPFDLWQPKRGIGAELFGEPGALAWTELYTHDVEAAARFYGGLFGWKADAAATPDGGEYTVFDLDGQPAAGMMAIREEWGEMPANWSIYLAVEDLEESLALVESKGGKVLNPPMEVEGVGRFSFIQDPLGAYLSVIQVASKGQDGT